MYRSVMTFGCAAVFLFAAAHAVAATQPVEQVLRDQRALRAQLEKANGPYSRFSDSAVTKLEQEQDKVFRLLQGKSESQLGDSERAELDASLAQIKAILAANEGNRLICRRERKTGSNMVEMRCETVADRAARTSDAEQDLRGVRGQYRQDGN